MFGRNKQKDQQIKMNYQRDYFIDAIYEAAKKDNDIFILSADFGAPALDKFRVNLKKQFIHMGISEQNMINVAAGLAMEGKKVFVYAMAPFVTLRCLEQHKCCSSLMNLPINTIVAGIGLGYADAGPTHYCMEDQASLRSLIGSHVYTVSDAISAKILAQYLLKNKKFSFSRLERLPVKDIYQNKKIDFKSFDNGFNYLVKSKKNNFKNLIIAQGYQTNRVYQQLIDKDLIDKFDLIDMYRSKPFPKNLLNIISKYKKVKIVDEQILSSSLASIVAENLLINSKNVNVESFNLKENHVFQNGGREKLLNENGLSIKKILQ